MLMRFKYGIDSFREDKIIFYISLESTNSLKDQDLKSPTLTIKKNIKNIWCSATFNLSKDQSHNFSHITTKI